MSIQQPIGVMDSGIGGLTVWQELVKIMPNENYLYFGDSGFCPYGSKDPEEIISRVKKIIDFLIQNGCKIIVVACNAITASSIEFLRKNYPIPFVGMEPAIKPALMKTKTKAIGVLATERALKGQLFYNTKAKYGRGIQIIEQVGHGLVESVEAHDFDSESTMEILKKYLHPMLEKNIDCLVLGCTHYPFLQESIKKILGDNISVLNPAAAVARQTLNVLTKMKLRTEFGPIRGESTFFTTGNTDIMKAILSDITRANCDVESISLTKA
jgi:glutamate racemase